MNAISTFFDRLFFAVTCVLGWVIFPMFILVGAAALLCYALIAELFSSMAAAPIDRDEPTAQSPASRLYRPLHP
jgi:hypothetical protein